MTIIEGQIETLKQLKEQLNSKGISRFSSIGDIQIFQKEYEQELTNIPRLVERGFNNELDDLNSKHKELKLRYENKKEAVGVELTNELNIKKTELQEMLAKQSKNIYFRIICYFRRFKLERNITKIEKNFDSILEGRLSDINDELEKIGKLVDFNDKNREKIINDRVSISKNKLISTKELIDDLYPLIAGAIGENSTVKEIEKLSDEYYLINDFSMGFNPPIYNKNTGDRIYSIQIDHVLISKAGVFILETKNWSKASLNSLDLRSPVEQIRRTSFAMFLLVNAGDFSEYSLKDHHWGERKIPIRNIIVMTNGKPREEFKHVKVLALNELNRYIQYFDPVLEEGEVKSLFNYLKGL